MWWYSMNEMVLDWMSWYSDGRHGTRMDVMVLGWMECDGGMRDDQREFFS